MMKVALVTGSNKGIGKEVIRQLAQAGQKTILTGRDEKKVFAAQEELKKQGITTDAFVLDVSRPESIQNLVKFVQEKFGKLDVLINNAGIFIDDATSELTRPQIVRDTFETNVLGPMQLIQAFLPLLRKSSDARIINVSSGMGGLTEMGGGYPAYRISKTALNAVTRIFANDLAAENIRINSICPGWVKTDMGGQGATREVAQGAETIVWLATAADIPSGKFLRDKKEILW